MNCSHKLFFDRFCLAPLLPVHDIIGAVGVLDKSCGGCASASRCLFGNVWPGLVLACSVAVTRTQKHWQHQAPWSKPKFWMLYFGFGGVAVAKGFHLLWLVRCATISLKSFKESPFQQMEREMEENAIINALILESDRKSGIFFMVRSWSQATKTSKIRGKSMWVFDMVTSLNLSRQTICKKTCLYVPFDACKVVRCGQVNTCFFWKAGLRTAKLIGH